MSTRAELKAKARESLKGNYGKLILALIVAVLIGSAVIMIGELMLMNENAGGIVKLLGFIIVIFGLLVTYYLTIGYVKMNLKVARNQETSLNDLFDKENISSTLRIVWVAIVMSIIMSVASMVIIPAFILPFSYAFVIIMAIEDGTGVDTLKKCRMMMKGHKWELFVLCLSFIGWILLVIVTCGIASLWVSPYMTVTQINYYDELRASQNTAA